MRILVAGSGAVGTVLGFLLHSGGSDVFLLARGQRLEQLRRGARTLMGGEERTAPIPVCCTPLSIGIVDAVLICTKTMSTAEILEDIRPCVGPETLVVSMQNGVGGEELISSAFGKKRAASGVAVMGSELMDDGLAKCYALEEIILGKWSDASLNIESLYDAFLQAGINTTISEDMNTEKWEKLIWNSAFNPVTAITRRFVEEVLADEAGRKLVLGLMYETALVARAHGCNISEYCVEESLHYPPEYAGFKTSMQQDMIASRKTEFESITGIVVREAAQYGIPVPLNETIYAILATSTNHISCISWRHA